MAKLPDTAGSARARMRLIAVILLSVITVYWAGYAMYLLFLPDGSTGATIAVVIGTICLVVGGLYALVTWGTVKVKRGLHLTAVVVVGIWLAVVVAGSAMSLASVIPIRLAAVPWDVWLLTAVNLAALVLLVRTIPVGAANGKGPGNKGTGNKK